MVPVIVFGPLLMVTVFVPPSRNIALPATPPAVGHFEPPEPQTPGLPAVSVALSGAVSTSTIDAPLLPRTKIAPPRAAPPPPPLVPVVLEFVPPVPPKAPGGPVRLEVAPDPPPKPPDPESI